VGATVLMVFIKPFFPEAATLPRLYSV